MIATPGLTFPTMQLNSFLSSDPRCLLSAHLFHTQHFWCVSQASCFSVSITSWANLEDVIRVISAPSGTAEDFKHQLSQAQYPYIPFLCQLKWNHEQHSSKPDFARHLALSSSSPRAPWPSADLHQSHRAAPQSTSHVSLVSVSRPGYHMCSTQSGQRLGYYLRKEQREGTGRVVSSRRRETLRSST